MTQHLYFVRHGRTEWNAIARMQGQLNSNLDEVGRAQAEISGRLLERCGIEALFVSPLDRTRQTAEIINARLHLPIVYDERIKEWDCGDWSGHLYSEVEQRWPEEWQAWRADTYGYRGPNCENYPDMIARATPFLDLLRAHPARRIAIVSHGMIGRVMVSTLLGHGREEMLAYRQPNDRVFRVSLGANEATVVHFDGEQGPFAGIDHDEPAPPSGLA